MLKKPTSKDVTNIAIQAGSMVAGAKLGDGVATLFPDSMNSYKRIILGVIGLGLASAIPAKTTASTAAQSAALGMGVKQLLDEVTDALTESVTVKVATDGTALAPTDKFVNALVGHKEPVLNVAGLSAAWGNDLVDDAMWERPQAQTQLAAFTGV